MRPVFFVSPLGRAGSDKVMSTDISYRASDERAGLQNAASITSAVITFWFAAVLMLTYLGFQLADGSGLVRSPDDAMRLVQVRDLLGGQSWFDPAQYRLDPPEGVVMHWSRLIDAPIAALIWVASLVTDRDMAVWIAAFVWPLTVLLGLIWVTARLSVRLGGRRTLIASLILPLLSVPLLFEFLPGRFDHHGVQIVLTLLLVLLIQHQDQNQRCALLAGTVASVMLAVGMEALPFVGAAALLYAGFWVRSGVRAAAGLYGFSVGLAGGTVGLFFLTISPDRYAVAACDALSVTYVAAAIIGAGISLLLASLSERLPATGHRFAAALLAAGGGAWLLGSLFPGCLAGPYSALDPRLASLWIEGIQEVASVFEIGAREPYLLLQYYLIPAAGLAAVCFAVLRQKGAERKDWLILAAFLVTAVLVALLQVRGAKFAIALAMPAGAWLITLGLAKSGSGQQRRPFGKWACGLAGLVFFTGIFHNVAAQSIASHWPQPSAVAAAKASRKAVRTCMRQEALTVLNKLPAGVMVAPVDLGAHILLHTKHSVLGAPYHRNQRGLLDTIDGFNAPLDVAYRRLRQRGVSYVLHCPGVRLAPANGVTAHNALGLHLAAGTPPAWLRPVPLEGETPLKLYRLY